MIRLVLKQTTNLLTKSNKNLISYTLYSQIFHNRSLQYSLINKPMYNFAKISKKQQQKKKTKQQKKKVKQQIGDATTFDLNPYEQKYKEIIQTYKQNIAHFKAGRLDPALFSHIYVKIGANNSAVMQLAQIAPKNANTCVLNPFDTDNLDAIQKAVQGTDYGFQVTKVDKTIVIVQPPNTMKEVKEKMLQKVKKAAETYKQKLGKVRHQSKEQFKKYKKIVPEDRLKNIQKQINSLYQKSVTQFQNTTKEKEKQLQK